MFCVLIYIRDFEILLKYLLKFILKDCDLIKEVVNNYLIFGGRGYRAILMTSNIDDKNVNLLQTLVLNQKHMIELLSVLNNNVFNLNINIS